MRVITSGILASFASLTAAAQSERTFAVLRFDGDSFMTEGRIDPIVSPGTTSAHLHGIMGGSNFGTTVEGDQLLSSGCTNAKIKNDKSNYWAPQVFFHDPSNGTFTKVPLFYMNVYYFFEPTDDEIEAFPVGLKMVVGDAMTRDPPAFGGGSNLDPGAGPIQPVQFTCPRSSYNPPSYPAGSDGTTAGMQDPNNAGAGAGFPLYPCDGYASPLRADIHFPSCYNPQAGLDDYKNNMAWPTNTDGKQNCPSGYTHVPHLFFELYWNTPLFNDLWTADGKSQPFVLANGDVTGYSSHADFISGWDQTTLKTIIDTCNAGSSGMDLCPEIPGGLNSDSDCKLVSPVMDILSLAGPVTALPGENPLSGWSYGSNKSSSSGSGSASSVASHLTAATKSVTLPVGTSSSTHAASDVTSQLATTGASTASYDGIGRDFSSTSTSKMLQVTTASGIESQVSAYAGTASHDSGLLTSTVWDLVTETHTITQWATETEPARRHLETHLGHFARHRRSGHMRR